MNEQQEFEAWWDADCDTRENPYSQHSMMYWAWEAWKASRAALAQPQQEPVAYLCENAVGHKYFRWKKPSSEYKPIALYTANPLPQRDWQGLTDEELLDIADMAYANDLELLQTLQAKLKEKNSV